MIKASLLLAGALAMAAVTFPSSARGAIAAPAGCGAGVSFLPAGAELTETLTETQAAGWDTSLLRDLEEMGNTGSFGSIGQDRAALVTTSGERTLFSRTLDGGATWSEFRALTPASTRVFGVTAAFTGSHIDVASETAGGRVFYRHSSDRGRTWKPTVRLVAADGVALARGPRGLVVLAGFDGAHQRFVARVSSNDGLSFGPQRTVGTYRPGPGCAYDPGRVAVTVSGGTIVVSFWRNPQQLVSRRSTDQGASWSSPNILSTTGQGWSNALVAHGSSVLAVFGSGDSLRSRLSVDGGTTWSPQTLIATRTFHAYPSWSGGAWQLVDARTNLLRYRTSTDGQHWTSPTVLFKDPDWEVLPVGSAILTSATVVPFIGSDWDLEQEWVFLARN